MISPQVAHVRRWRAPKDRADAAAGADAAADTAADTAVEECDSYTAWLKHNDRAILDGDEKG